GSAGRRSCLSGHEPAKPEQRDLDLLGGGVGQLLFAAIVDARADERKHLAGALAAGENDEDESESLVIGPVEPRQLRQRCGIGAGHPALLARRHVACRRVPRAQGVDVADLRVRLEGLEAIALAGAGPRRAGGVEERLPVAERSSRQHVINPARCRAAPGQLAGGGIVVETVELVQGHRRTRDSGVVSARRRAARPRMSATTDTAISIGALPPTDGRPMGHSSTASSSSDNPRPASRRRQRAPLEREPISPRYAASPRVSTASQISRSRGWLWVITRCQAPAGASSTSAAAARAEMAVTLPGGSSTKMPA